MDLLIDILLDAGKDTLSLVPFLLVTYLALETLEHVAGDRVNGAIKRAGAAGPVVGSLLGMVPQCGFSAMAATLYAGRVVTLGTLVAVFLSTSDEMLPLLLAEQVPVQTMAMLLASKALIALVTGFIVDAAIRGLRRNARAHAAIRRTVLGTAANPAHVNCAHDDHTGGDIIDEGAEAPHSTPAGLGGAEVARAVRVQGVGGAAAGRCDDGMRLLRRAAGHGGKGCGAGVSHGSAAGRIPCVCARFFRPAGLSAHPRLHRKAGLVNGRRVPCDAAAFLCRAPMVSPFFHTRMIVLSHPWPILKATSGKKEDVDL